MEVIRDEKKNFSTCTLNVLGNHPNSYSMGRK